MSGDEGEKSQLEIIIACIPQQLLIIKARKESVKGFLSSFFIFGKDLRVVT